MKAIVVGIALAALAIGTIQPGGRGDVPLVQVAEADLGEEACPEGPALAQAPVADEYLRNLSPVGTLVPPDHVFPTPHMYFYVKNDATPDDIEAPVVSPGDVLVTAIGIQVYDRLGAKSDYPVYSIYFTPCADLELYIFNLRRFTHPALLAATELCVPEPLGPTRQCRVAVSVRLAAGEEIGTTGDRQAGLGGIDLGARDYRLTTGRDFANPDRWCTAGSRAVWLRCYTICPLDLLPAAVREPLLDRFVDFSGTVKRTEEPRCGSVYRDLAATAQGTWFRTGNVPRAGEGPHVYLGPTAFTSTVEVFSMGTSVPGVAGGAYHFAPREAGLVNRRFADLPAEVVACYETLFRRLDLGPTTGNVAPETTLLVRLSGTSLEVERRAVSSCGEAPWTIGPDAVHFER
ncbi:MAG: hypothetical protein U0556_18005 [Dehalococcoidia bacterium]